MISETKVQFYFSKIVQNYNPHYWTLLCNLQIIGSRIARSLILTRDESREIDSSMTKKILELSRGFSCNPESQVRQLYITGSQTPDHQATSHYGCVTISPQYSQDLESSIFLTAAHFPLQDINLEQALPLCHHYCPFHIFPL